MLCPPRLVSTSCHLLCAFVALFIRLFFYDLRRRRRGSASTRAHYHCWNVCGLKKSQHTAKPFLLTAAVSLSKGGAQPSFQPSNFSQETTKFEGLRNTTHYWRCCKLIPLLHVLDRAAVLLHVLAELLVSVSTRNTSRALQPCASCVLPGVLPFIVFPSRNLLFSLLVFVHTHEVSMELSSFPTRPSASVQRIKVAIMRCGCKWTLLTINMLTRHEENTSSGSSSKKGPVHTRLTRRSADMMMKATAQFHLCRLYENACFHKQRV